MFVLLFLHIATMFTFVGLVGAVLVPNVIAARARKWTALAAFNDLGGQRLIAPVFVAGGVFGLLTAISFGYNVLAPWLLIAYVLFAITAFHGARIVAQETSRLLPQLVAGEGAQDAALVRRFDRAMAVDAVSSVGLIALLVADMVFKPFL